MAWLPVIQRLVLVLLFVGLSSWNLAAWSPGARGFWVLYTVLLLGLPLALYWLDRRRLRGVPVRSETNRWAAVWVRLGLYLFALALMASAASVGFGFRTGRWESSLWVFVLHLVLLGAQIIGLEMWITKQRRGESVSGS